MLAAADAGAEDVEREESSFRATSAPEDLHAVRAALEQAGITIESSEATMLPKTNVSVEDEAVAKKVVRLMDALEENEDVQSVYANFDIPERALEAVARLAVLPVRTRVPRLPRPPPRRPRPASKDRLSALKPAMLTVTRYAPRRPGLSE